MEAPCKKTALVRFHSFCFLSVLQRDAPKCGSRFRTSCPIIIVIVLRDIRRLIRGQASSASLWFWLSLNCDRVFNNSPDPQWVQGAPYSVLSAFSLSHIARVYLLCSSASRDWSRILLCKSISQGIKPKTRKNRHAKQLKDTYADGNLPISLNQSLLSYYCKSSNQNSRFGGCIAMLEELTINVTRIW